MTHELSSKARPGRQAAGFTIVELMIVVAIIAILAVIAVPNLIAARESANETAAIQTARSICTAEAQFWKSTMADEDGDATGEYGTLGEMSGKVGVRGGASKAPTDLSASMRLVSGFGEVSKSGYLFRMYLPGPGGIGQREAAGGGLAAGVVDTDESEVRWCCYAYPISYGMSGTRTFFINEHAEISFTDAASYSGANCTALRAGAAFRTGTVDSMTGAIAVGTRGSDGNFWRPVQ